MLLALAGWRRSIDAIHLLQIRNLSNTVKNMLSGDTLYSRGSGSRFFVALKESFVILILTCAVYILFTRLFTVDIENRTAFVSLVAIVSLLLSITFFALCLAAGAPTFVHNGEFQRINLLTLPLVAMISGLIAGIQTLILSGTRYTWYGINAGDTVTISNLASTYLSKGYEYSLYPPLPPLALGWYSQFRNLEPFFAWKSWSIMIGAIAGGLTYLAWRMLFSEITAAALTISSLIFNPPWDATYYQLTLSLFLPIMLFGMHILRGSIQISVLGEISFALIIAVLFLTYSGHFWWFFPSFIGAIVIAVRNGNTLRVLRIISFTIVLCSPYIYGLLKATQLSVVQTGSLQIIQDEFSDYRVSTIPIRDVISVSTINPTVTPIALACLVLTILFSRKLLVSHEVQIFVLLATSILIMRYLTVAQVSTSGFYNLWPRSNEQIQYLYSMFVVFAIITLLRYAIRYFSLIDPATSKTFRIFSLCGLLIFCVVGIEVTFDGFFPTIHNEWKFSDPGWLAYDAEKNNLIPENLVRR